MSTLKTYLNIQCYSFTLLVLIHSALGWFEIYPAITVEGVFMLFAITLCTTVFIMMLDRIPIKSNPLRSLLQIAAIMLVVFGMGFLGGTIPVRLDIILSVVGVILLIYFCVYGILMIKDQSDAKAINKQIMLNRSKMDPKSGGDRSVLSSGEENGNGSGNGHE